MTRTFKTVLDGIKTDPNCEAQPETDAARAAEEPYDAEKAWRLVQMIGSANPATQLEAQFRALLPMFNRTVSTEERGPVRAQWLALFDASADHVQRLLSDRNVRWTIDGDQYGWALDRADIDRLLDRYMTLASRDDYAALLRAVEIRWAGYAREGGLGA